MDTIERTDNLKTITIKQFKEFVRSNIQQGIITPTFGIGKPGIGKTESMVQLANELGIGYKELRLVSMTEADLLGIPYIDEQYGTTDWKSNTILPRVDRDGERGILVLDEFTSAPRNIQTIALQLLERARRIGTYKLPDGWYIVLLGNGPEDGGHFEASPKTVTGRCYSCRIDFNHEVWRQWAIQSDVHPTIIAYLSNFQDDIYRMDLNMIVEAYPSPRTWVHLSNKLKAAEKSNGGRVLDNESVEIYACMSVGTEVGMKFAGFYQFNNQMVPIEDILNGKAKPTLTTMRQEVVYLTAYNIVRAIANLVKDCKDNCPKEVLDKVINALKWVAVVGKNENLDLAIMVYRDLGENVPNIARIVTKYDKYFDEKCPEFLEFYDKHAKVFE
jgi:hypothetical protein